MRLFFDTSSLFKLYHREADTPKVEALFLDNKVEAVFISEIAKSGVRIIRLEKAAHERNHNNASDDNAGSL